MRTRAVGVKMEEDIKNEEQLNNEELPEENLEEEPIQEEPAEEPTEEEPEEEPKEEEPAPSRRESLRIQKLIEKMRESNKTPEPPTPSGIDYGKELDADEEVIRKLDEDRRMASDMAFSQGLERSKSIQFHTRLEIDAPIVKGKYPELDDRNKEKFDPGLADAINSMYLDSVGFDAKTDTVRNSSVRYADYVDSIFELGDRIATGRVEKSVKNVAKQASKAGIRPDGSSSKRLDLNKPISQMTNEELDAYGKKLGLNTVKY